LVLWRAEQVDPETGALVKAPAQRFNQESQARVRHVK
jgi:hypothetical protein